MPELQFPDGQGRVDKWISLNAWCKVTVLCLKNCGLGRTRAVSLAEATQGKTSRTAEGPCRLQR